VVAVRCPVCATSVKWATESLFRPFCSERCKLIDLGTWAAETYSAAGSVSERVDGSVTPDDPKE
jgi:endogenous inhibitor of DNA gyrase (YacG/DUF329 family)